MATISDSSITHELHLTGYRLNSTLEDTDAGALALFADRDDIRLVRGASINGRPDVFEFAVMVSRDCLYFKQPGDADRFAAAVLAAGFEAVISVDDDADEFDDPFKYCVVYTGPEVTAFSESHYSRFGRLASRFAR